MYLDENAKMKFTACVTHVNKMDSFVEGIGDYVELRLNDIHVASWKINVLDEMLIFNGNPHYNGDYGTDFREVDKDGLAEFVAARFGELFDLVRADENL